MTAWSTCIQSARGRWARCTRWRWAPPSWSWWWRLARCPPRRWWSAWAPPGWGPPPRTGPRYGAPSLTTNIYSKLTEWLLWTSSHCFIYFPHYLGCRASRGSHWLGVTGMALLAELLFVVENFVIKYQRTAAEFISTMTDWELVVNVQLSGPGFPWLIGQAGLGVRVVSGVRSQAGWLIILLGKFRAGAGEGWDQHWPYQCQSSLDGESRWTQRIQNLSSWQDWNLTVNIKKLFLYHSLKNNNFSKIIYQTKNHKEMFGFVFPLVSKMLIRLLTSVSNTNLKFASSLISVSIY